MPTVSDSVRSSYAAESFMIERNVRRGLDRDREIERAVERRREDVRVTISDEGRRASSVEGGSSTRETQKVIQTQNAEKLRLERDSQERNNQQNRERLNAISSAAVTQYQKVANI